MAEVKVKKAKKKVSAGKVVGETIKFLACPPYKIGEWISEAVDKKAAQKEAAGKTDGEKKELRDQKIEKAKDLKDEGKNLDEIADTVSIEEVEVKEKEDESDKT